MFGNISAIALQVKQAAPTFTSTSIALAATWTPLVAQAGATGIRIIPVNNFETTPGEPITEGGNDQTTYKGRKKLKYVGFTDASYMMEGVSAAIAKAVAAYTQFSAKAGQRSSLHAFFLTDEDYIISGPDFNGIEIWAHVVQDVKKGGSFKLEDNYAVTFSMDYGWSLEAVTTKASFDVLSLKNP
jgi:hypothetical protein